jgi:hypothetical protein
VSVISESLDAESGRPGGPPDSREVDQPDASPRTSRQLELEVSLLGSERGDRPRVGSGNSASVPGPTDRVQGAGAVILLVVEDSDMRGYLRGCLAHETTEIAEVLEAASLSTAKRQVAEFGIDVIIAEGPAASGTGLELYRALQARDEFRGLPVILVVDEPIPDEVRRLSSATLRVLARPFNASRLCEAVRRTIKAGARMSQTRDQ